MLFISSYVPLYVLLIIKNILERCTDEGKFTVTLTQLKTSHYFDEVNDYAIVALLFLSVISFLYLKNITKKSGGVHYYKVISIEDQTGNMYFNYISIYLLSCMGLTLNSIVDVFVLIFLMLIVGYIYISNHMTYMNPVLQFLGFKIYEGSIESESTGKVLHSIIVVNKSIFLKPESSYMGSGKEDFIFILSSVVSETNWVFAFFISALKIFIPCFIPDFSFIC